ncbi:branched-chain amino acid ABC transporter permease [bacterium]|nr:branched-chain amino acid ABC transporter permease [bacterium]
MRFEATGSYRHGYERFVPAPVEMVLLAALFIFCWKLYGGINNSAVAGMSSVVIVAIAWVLGMAIRVATNDLRWWLLIGFGLAVLAPFLAGNNYQVGIMAQVCVFTMMILGLNIVVGYTGQISIGHGALVGISAYFIAVLTHYSGWPMWPAIIVAVFITTAFGALLGIPALRLAGPYLAIATLAVALIFPLVVKLDQFQKYDGGNSGIREERITPPSGLDSLFKNNAPATYKNEFAKSQFSQQTYIYYILLAAAIIGTWGAWNLTRSRFGRAFVAVRDSEVAATAMGINTALYKVMAFGISAFYAGIAGALFWVEISFVSTESFDLFNLSIYPLAYMVIGGLATIGGSLLGAFGYLWVPQTVLKIATIDQGFGDLQGAITGLLLVVFMTRLPQGVWGWVLGVNRYSWRALSADTRALAARPQPTFWAFVAAAIVIVILTGAFIGSVWSLFAAGLFIVAPTSAWTSVFAPFRRATTSLLRRARGRPRPPESAPADAG